MHVETDSYDGQWENDKIKGKGIYTRKGDTEGDCWTASSDTWYKNKSKDAIVRYTNNDTYFGEFDLVKGRHGVGILCRKHRYIYEGKGLWSKNIKHAATLWTLDRSGKHKTLSENSRIHHMSRINALYKKQRITFLTKDKSFTDQI